MCVKILLAIHMRRLREKIAKKRQQWKPRKVAIQKNKLEGQESCELDQSEAEDTLVW